MQRKRPLEFLSEKDAKEQWKLILSLKMADLLDPGKKTLLPYPGMGSVCTRPPVFLLFVGRDRLVDLLINWEHVTNPREVIIYGCKGIGKSTEFRALACLLYERFKTQYVQGEVRHRVVFIWAETLLADVIASVKNALLFCFLGDADDDGADWQQVKAAIESIGSLERVVSFIEKRKQAQNEKFYFLVDGGEKLDAVNVFGKPVYDSVERSTVSKDLKPLWNTGARIWWCTSIKSHLVVEESFDAPCIEVKNASLTEDEYDTYAGDSFLGDLDRWDDVKAYTGLVPLFLDALKDCCRQFAKEMMLSEMDQRVSNASNVEAWNVIQVVAEPTDAEIVDLLEEDEYWDTVLSKFTQHGDVRMVHRKAAAIQLPRDWDVRRSIEIDPTYVTDGEYCSSYVKKVYMEALRNKEEQQKPYADGAWMAYTRWLLSETNPNWGTLGWLCESVLASVIPKRGLKLGQKVDIQGKMVVIPFQEIPSRRIKDLLGRPSGWCCYFKPDQVNFSHVDAVVISVDEDTNVHLVFLQYGVNIDSHFDSAEQFMNLLNLRLWFPDLDEYVTSMQDEDEAISQDEGGKRGRGRGSHALATSSMGSHALASSSRGSHALASSSNSSSKVKLHFVFLGCSSVPGYSSGLKPGSLRESRSGVQSGIPEYELHIQPFDDKAIPGLSPEDYHMLAAIAEHRIWRTSYDGVCPQGVGLLALTRSQLEKMAKDQYGITDPSRSRYKNKAVLINEICALDKAS